jgi:hypothetical protein
MHQHFSTGNRGQWREGHWVFGGVERNSEKYFLVEVPDRTEVTLLGIILVERYSDVLRDTVLLIILLLADPANFVPPHNQ